MKKAIVLVLGLLSNYLYKLPVVEATSNPSTEIVVEITQRPPATLKETIQHSLTSFPKTGENTTKVVSIVGVILVILVAMRWWHYKSQKLGDTHEK
ncbi:LPXTG cell wall anchor domain-containing protein [Vagococcus xieshaowenii]|uniref:LPXTG cell wall anchor domain-containing protein n=1 Tax=Vagococcus xieshaowenii TaxID=2562451 RepID=A0AAJ5EFT1_9ENTE|nr:LPXTG cell wall anchor domain-containing protein [Vagococcus xieshaowenii]QCA28051.1 LPXTG cell wall anchor domain-containing protein [Vagococcus xieshaowenii]TFZ42093.1 LPXTG cell wall anchor domain-containing protein [Vagococcus xieshaowenii]